MLKRGQHISFREFYIFTLLFCFSSFLVAMVVVVAVFLFYIKENYPTSKVNQEREKIIFSLVNYIIIVSLWIWQIECWIVCLIVFYWCIWERKRGGGWRDRKGRGVKGKNILFYRLNELNLWLLYIHSVSQFSVGSFLFCFVFS